MPPKLAATPMGDSQHKLFAIIGYIIPILFFIPLLSDAKDNAFAKFHANQQLNLLLVWVVIYVLGFIPIIGWALIPFVSIAALILMIMGVLNAVNNNMKELPLIGKYQLIK